MAITLAKGSKLQIAKTYTPALGTAATATTQITTANPAVVSATNTLAAGDYVVLTSGWGLLDGKCVRVASSPAPTGTTFALEGVDCSDTTKYPGGVTGGAGTFRKVATWSEITQLKSLSFSGGSQNYTDITTLADSTQRQAPTTRSPVTVSVETYDDPSLSWYADVVAADNAQIPYAMLLITPNGPSSTTKLVANSYWSVMRVPKISSGNDPLLTQIDLSFYAEPVRYST